MNNTPGRSENANFAVLRLLYQVPLPWLALQVGGALVALGHVGQDLRAAGLKLQNWGKPRLEKIVRDLEGRG